MRVGGGQPAASPLSPTERAARASAAKRRWAALRAADRCGSDLGPCLVAAHRGDIEAAFYDASMRAGRFHGVDVLLDVYDDATARRRLLARCCKAHAAEVAHWLAGRSASETREEG